VTVPRKPPASLECNALYTVYPSLPLLVQPTLRFTHKCFMVSAVFQSGVVPGNSSVKLRDQLYSQLYPNGDHDPGNGSRPLAECLPGHLNPICHHPTQTMFFRSISRHPSTAAYRARIARVNQAQAVWSTQSLRFLNVATGAPASHKRKVWDSVDEAIRDVKPGDTLLSGGSLVWAS